MSASQQPHDQHNRSTREPDPMPKPTGVEKFGHSGSEIEQNVLVNGKPLAEWTEEEKRRGTLDPKREEQADG